MIYSLRARGPRLYKSHRDWYQVIQLTCTMGYVALTTHLHPSNYNVSQKGLKRVPSNRLNHRSRCSSIESCLTLRAVRLPTLFLSNSGFLLFKTMTLSLLRTKGRLLCRFYLEPDRYSSIVPWQSLRWIADKAVNRSTHTVINVRRLSSTNTL